MAYSMNLRDIVNPQYWAVTGKKQKIPYTAYLTALGPSVRDTARQEEVDALRERELLQGTTQFNATQALEKQRLDIAANQANQASAISLGQTGLAGAYMADKAGLINLPNIAGGIFKSGAGSSYSLANTAGAMTPGTSVPAAAGAGGAAPIYVPEALTVDASLAPLSGVESAAGAAEGATALEGTATATAGAEGAASTGTGLWGAAGGQGAAPAGVYALPAAAGYFAPKLVDAIHEDSMKNLGKNISLGFIEHEKTARTVGSGATGAAAGALAGAALTSWSGPGAIIGAGIGAIAGAVSGGCIIVTACTSADSEEVNIARQYRDKFLTQAELRGYYMIAERVVPFIGKHPSARRLVKRFLVDNLITYGRHALAQEDQKGLTPGFAAIMITRGFLALCRAVGRQKELFVRCNGEIV